MPAHLLDMFPPEIQTLYGAAAIVSAVLGLMVWGAGIKIARLSVALLLGISAAALAAWGLPSVLGIAPVTAALIGFALGMLTGAVTFRFLQGVMLAVCLGIAVGGVYFRMEVARTPPSASPIASATLPVEQLQIATSRLPITARHAATQPADEKNQLDAVAVMGTLRQAGEEVKTMAVQRWEAIPPTHRFWMGLLAGLTAVTVLLVSVVFPRHTTWVATAALGTAILVGAGYVLIGLYAPQYGNSLPTKPEAVWGIAGGVMLVGLVLQRSLFWKRTKKKYPSEEPVAAAA